MNCYLDIETLPTTDADVIAEIAANIKPPANYSKPETIAKWMEENKEQAVKEAVHKTGFSGLYGSIACICYAFDDGEVFSVDCRDGEEKMLEQLYAHVFSASGVDTHNGMVSMPVTFIGHNIIGFDLPFIKHRSIINQVKPPIQFRKAFDAKPWSAEVADTMLMWSSDKEKRASMDKLCKAFGIQGKGDFDGSMVADTWPTDPQKVIDYCADDVRRTRDMFKRMTFDFGQMSFLKAA